ncbi:Ditrans,polycis-undecaprenyl-diphosphate synthase ((2E,6E)-farnesyl-diphosphate specific) [subsurface metagenome]
MDLQHVAIVPDGNRRWSKLRGAPVLEGHRRGAKVMHTVVDYLIDHQVRYLTVWGFSTDNWKRSDDEIKDLLHVLAFWIDKDAPWLHERGVRLYHIGRLDQLPDFLQLAINQAVELTKNNEGMTLNLAFNYTGRGEILDAVRQLVNEVTLSEAMRLIVDDEVTLREIDETSFSRHLYTDGMPDVDLVIRTAGEFRLSNFMLWQTAYSEYYFTELLWPDFDIKELEKALQAYSQRKRRFGGD